MADYGKPLAPPSKKLPMLLELDEPHEHIWRTSSVGNGWLRQECSVHRCFSWQVVPDPDYEPDEQPKDAPEWSWLDYAKRRLGMID